MKATLTIFLCTLFFSGLLAQQVPQGMNYQAIARELDGTPIASLNLPVKIQIFENGGTNPIFEESHTVTTSNIGLFNLKIGAFNQVGFSNIDWSTGVKTIKVTIAGEEGNITELLSVPYALYAQSAGNASSFEAGDGIAIVDGVISNTGDDDSDPDNELQALTLSGNTLTLSQGGGSVTLSGGTDSQNLSVSGNQLSIFNGNTVNIDGSTTNEIQTIALSGNQLTLSQGGGSVTLSGGTDSQNLSVSGNQLSISNGNSVNIDGSPNNEIQSLTLSGNQLTLSQGGGSVSLPAEVDGSTTNEIQTLSLSGTQLSLSNGGGSVNLPSTGGGSDSQTLSVSGSQLSISNGNTVTLPADGDGNSFNEIQTLSLSGTQLSLSNGGGSVNLPSTGGGSDSQTLSVSGSQLSISNGNTVNLPAEVDGSTTNEIQTISLSGTQLTLSNGGGTVNLPSTGGGTYTAGNGISINGTTISNTGDLSSSNEFQSLSLSGNTLSISPNGNSVTLPSTGGGSYTAGSGISINGTVISANDPSPTNELQSISLNGSQLTLSQNGGTVTLPVGDNFFQINSNGNGTTCGTGLLPFDCTQCAPGYSSFKVTNNCDGNAIHGVANSSAGIKAGVFGEAQGFEGNGVWGECNVGNDAWGVYGKSNTGYGIVGYTGNLSNGTVGAAGLFNHRIVVSNVGQFNYENWAFNPYAILSWTGVSTSSDRRFKKDIEPISYGLNEVLKMNPVAYHWKSEEKAAHKSLGFIAQEMQELVPNVVTQLKDDDGLVEDLPNPYKDGEGQVDKAPKLAMNYQELTPVLVKAIQEQQAQIEGLKAELKARDEQMAQFAQRLAELEKMGKGTANDKK